MDPKDQRQQIDKWHEFLKANLYPKNDLFRHKIDEAFLSERPSKSDLDFARKMFYEINHSMLFSRLAIYDSKFSIQEDLDHEWLEKAIARMSKHLLKYPKLAYVNSPCYDEPYLNAIFHFDDILKIDEYRSFWRDFSAGIKGNPGTALTEQKEQLKQEVELELKDQLKQEVKAELKDQLKEEVKVELKDLLKQEVKAELKDQLKQEVKVELKDQLKQEVKVELQDQLKQEVKAELKHLLEHDVKLELKDQLKQNWE